MLKVLNYTGLCTLKAHARLQSGTRMSHVICFLCKNIAAQPQPQSLQWSCATSAACTNKPDKRPCPGGDRKQPWVQQAKKRKELKFFSFPSPGLLSNIPRVPQWCWQRGNLCSVPRGLLSLLPGAARNSHVYSRSSNSKDIPAGRKPVRLDSVWVGLAEILKLQFERLLSPSVILANRHRAITKVSGYQENLGLHFCLLCLFTYFQQSGYPGMKSCSINANVCVCRVVREESLWPTTFTSYFECKGQWGEIGKPRLLHLHEGSRSQ